MRVWPCLLAGLLLTVPLSAQAGFRGEVDLEAGHYRNRSDSLDAALGFRTHDDQDLKVRLMWTGELWAGWGLDVAYLPELEHGANLRLADAESMMLSGLSNDPDRAEVFDLTQTITQRGDTRLSHRLDRLALSYSGDHLVLRVGRQALTWGGGLVFHPMDLFNPFPPNATYTAYKPGTDMAYGQWLFENGSDLQAVVVPRREAVTQDLSSTSSSAGLKWHTTFGDASSLDLLLAQDAREHVAGLELTTGWKGATWTAELVPTRLPGGVVTTSWLVNAQWAGTWKGRNISGFAELFHNGLGIDPSAVALAQLPPTLASHLARGELFTLSRYQVAMGGELQWTPLVSIKPTVLYSPADGSFQVLEQTTFSLSQNAILTLGFQEAWGPGRTEYGGLETDLHSGIFVRPPNQLYARLTYYF